MSELIKHECGIAYLRLLKPIDHYIEKYGSAFYGINKMFLLMQKQHNRGQDGAGFVSLKLDPEPGHKYIFRKKSIDAQPIQAVFKDINGKINSILENNEGRSQDAKWLKDNLPYLGEIYLGHLRYGTYGINTINQTHPFVRENNWMHRNLITAGNFNMTNVDQLFQQLISIGQHPKEKTDSLTILERIGHFLDEEVDDLYFKFKEQGYNKQDASPMIAEHLDMKRVLERAAKKWDGGYVICGIVGHGDSFILRDPHAIRPAYWYADDEIVVAASERSVIQTVFRVGFDEVQEIPGGHAVLIKKNGSISVEMIQQPLERKSCSFERIYFSRGSDAEIYRERIELGKRVCPAIMDVIGGDIENSVFSFIPNTAEVAYLGMLKGMEDYQKKMQREQLLALENHSDIERIDRILDLRVRTEKIAIKDVKLRTFITEDHSRDDLVTHVYDVTYGTVKPGDNLVVIDDSIVRGTTLQKSIIRILDTLGPRKIVIVSSAPQIRYPDCYGIDMVKLNDFIAFRAAIALLKEKGMEQIIEETYRKCLSELEKEDGHSINHVKDIYAPFTDEQISRKIAEMIREESINAEVEVVYQTVEDLHAACPKNPGDWYFTGDYPTPGGMKVVNKSFVYFYEGKNVRAY